MNAPDPAGTQPPDSAHGSGLRNPAAAARGVAAGTLVMEAVVMLLAIAPLVRVGGDRKGAAIGLVVVLAALCVTAAGMLRRPWGWYLGGLVQVMLIFGGLLHWSLSVLGVLFGLVWLYVLNVRRTVLGGTP